MCIMLLICAVCKQYATSVYAHYPYDVGEGYYAVDLCASNEALLFLGVGENEVVPREFPHTVTTTSLI